MTDNNNGWLERPGVPLNPERDGWHWVGNVTREWIAQFQLWQDRHGYSVPPPTWGVLPYGGPCLTPTEVEHHTRAAAAAAWIAARDDAADIADGIGEHGSALEIRALPLPAAAQAALDAVVRKAAMREREACADMIDCGCPCRDAVLAMLRRDGARKAQHECKAGRGSDCCALQAAAIRALGEAE